ncbi:MAG: carbon-nitrogen hydrolase family protein [Glaciecola sp.]|jgi:predicted amidohydrolase
MMDDLIAIQITSGPNINANLDAIETELVKLDHDSALVVLPECFACFDAGDKVLMSIAEEIDNGHIQTRIAALAKQYNKWIVAGTIPVKAQQGEVGYGEDRFYAASLVYDNQGHRVRRYDKIHMFDVSVNDNTNEYRESASTLPGQHVVFFESPWGRVGQIVCYDLRFPELAQRMGQIDVLVVPSAFTLKTGEAHWHALLAARSIENQCYVIAANQTGVHSNGRETYGNSCIYSPWGELLANLPENQGKVGARYQHDLLSSIRQSMPIQTHKTHRTAF